MGEFAAIAEHISIDGGVSVNPYFCQFLADVLGRQVSVKAMAELTALGTAALAGGDDILLAADAETQIDYFPNADMSRFIDRFSEAVTRAKHWRS